MGTRKPSNSTLPAPRPSPRIIRPPEMLSSMEICNISGGRMILGLGRGAGKVEFEGFRVPMDESRERFVESARMILEGLETGFCELAGRFVSQPRAAIRPAH